MRMKKAAIILIFIGIIISSGNFQQAQIATNKSAFIAFPAPYRISMSVLPTSVAKNWLGSGRRAIYCRPRMTFCWPTARRISRKPRRPFVR